MVDVAIVSSHRSRCGNWLLVLWLGGASVVSLYCLPTWSTSPLLSPTGCTVFASLTGK
ncbi:hypothetical protein QR685DRAFT_178547 [Neurospora intermedia]|uniref:Uncharacterized protein n=1 Tax=Neurospora intermedia TaxID=5142 RepID=A0ABR3DP06_NEUIN